MDKKTDSFDPTKPVALILHGNQCPARIIATDAKSNRPIVALCKVYGTESPVSFYRDGTTTVAGFRLVNIPDVRYEYQNVYKARGTSASRYNAMDVPNKVAEMKGRFGMLEYKFIGDELDSVRIMDESEWKDKA